MRIGVIDKTFVEIVIELHVIFNDARKVESWLKTKNLNFGGTSPLVLIREGRSRTVLQYIQSKNKF